MINIKQGGLRLLYKQYIDFVLTYGYELIIVSVFVLAITLGFIWG